MQQVSICVAVVLMLHLCPPCSAVTVCVNLYWEIELQENFRWQKLFQRLLQFITTCCCCCCCLLLLLLVVVVVVFLQYYFFEFWKTRNVLYHNKWGHFCWLYIQHADIKFLCRIKNIKVFLYGLFPLLFFSCSDTSCWLLYHSWSGVSSAWPGISHQFQSGAFITLKQSL